MAMQFANEQETKRASDDSRNGKHIRIAVKIWSELLQAHLWVVADDKDIELFRTHGLRGEIYTSAEIQKINCMDKGSMQAVHELLFDEIDEASILGKA
jgi:hypothetical protein